MAEAELTLSYREPPVVWANRLLWLAVPVVLLFVILAGIGILSVESVPWSNISLFVFGLLVLLGANILGLLITSDDTIFLTRDGISFPFVVRPGLGLRKHYSWSDLSAVKYVPNRKYGILILKFKDGAGARLKLDLLQKAVIENLIVSIDVWTGGTDAFPALLDARVRLEESSGLNQLPGYTEIWEEELTRRFGPTNFIPLEPGQEVRGLKVERQLAFGGLSAIYLTSDHDRKHFVLKEAVVPPDADEAMRDSAEKMLSREASILASLSHPNIATVLDSFIESGRHYILMELIKGEDLRSLVKEKGTQSESEVLPWTVQLLDILTYLHQQDPPVIHRDLSPDNLMLRENGDICVIDFGAANHFVGTATGTLIGKQAYIAPEQLRGKAEPLSDIYALGCTLFFLLTGKDPEPLSVARPREINSSISPELDEIIASCTAQEAQDRPPTAAALNVRISQLLKVAPNV